MQTNIRNQKGFTLIELVVVMVILALLAAVAVPKFFDLQKQAEAASVKKVIGNLRSALSIRTAKALVDGEDLATLATKMNQTDGVMYSLLSNKPESYIGVVTTNQPAEPKGIWYDRTSGNGWVMYKLKNADIIDVNGGWDDAGKNIILRIETIVENGKTVGLELTPTATYDYDWQY